MTFSARDPKPDAAALVRLMVEYQKGRIDAFERLHEALAGDLRRHFQTVAPPVAADLVQETFLELHRSRRTYLSPLPVRPWVFGVARNVLRRHRRLAFRRASHEAGAREEWADPASPSFRPTSVEPEDVERALRQVPSSRRAAWELHHVEGWSFEEIGRKLGIPVPAAKLRSSRAMSTLRSLLGIGKGDRRG